MHSIFLLIAFLCFYNIQCATISFDTSIAEDCLEQNGGCAFNNTNIWINNTIPSTNDYVIISPSTTFSSVLVVLPEGYEVQVKSMTLQGVNFKLYNGSWLNITVLEVGPSSLFSVEDDATLLGIGASNLTVNPSAAFYVYGTSIWYAEKKTHHSLHVTHFACILPFVSKSLILLVYKISLHEAWIFLQISAKHVTIFYFLFFLY